LSRPPANSLTDDQRKALQTSRLRVAVLSDGEPALPGLVRAAVGEAHHLHFGLVAHPCGFSTSSQRCAGSMPLARGTERHWKSSSGELGARSI
jgi:hypothetical protein